MLLQQVIIKKAEALNKWQTEEAKRKLERTKKIKLKMAQKYKGQSKGLNTSCTMFDDIKSPRGSQGSEIIRPQNLSSLAHFGQPDTDSPNKNIRVSVKQVDEPEID